MHFDLLYLKQLIQNNFQIKNIDECINKIIVYQEFLNEKNKVMNLTRLNDQTKIYEQYFWNSLMPFINVDLENKKVLDIGSGSGIPGIILKIIYPSINLYIIEANKKKITFLKELCIKLNFNDVVFLNQRAEEVDKQWYEQFDIVTSRAVASIGVLIEISSIFLKINGLLIEPKSINYEVEWNLVKNKIDDYGLILNQILHLNDHQVVFYFKKIKACNKKYPRTWNQIIKDYKVNE